MQEQNKEKQALLKKLSDYMKERTKSCTDSYPGHMTKCVEKLAREGSVDIDFFVTSIWESVKDMDKKERVDKFLNLSKDNLNRKEEECKNRILQHSKEYWTKNKSQLQEECCKIIKADEHLTPDEQRFLEDFIMKLDIHFGVDARVNVSPDDVSIHLINIFGYEFLRINWIAQKKTKRIYSNLLGGYIRKVNAAINFLHDREFKEWNRRLETGLTKEVVNFNPKLRKLSEKLDEYQRELETYKLQLSLIEGEQLKVSQMFEFKKREE